MSRILIVEDEESIAELEKDYLELSGFEVEIENDGEEGLHMALHEDFDLVILDLMLPGVDGFEICRKVREVKKHPDYHGLRQKKRISIRSGAWAWELMITSQNPLAPVRWLPG